MLSYFVFQNMLGRGGGQRGCLLPTLMYRVRIPRKSRCSFC